MACARGCCGSFREHALSVAVSPAATPSRRNKVAPRTADPSWERGIPTDERRMPFLAPGTVRPMGQKEVVTHRSEIETRRRDLRNRPRTEA